jgi:hypothetical protein
MNKDVLKRLNGGGWPLAAGHGKRNALFSVAK